MSASKAARLLDVTVTTLHRWEREGRPIMDARRQQSAAIHRIARAFLRLRRNEPAPPRIVTSHGVAHASQAPDPVCQRRVVDACAAARSDNRCVHCSRVRRSERSTRAGSGTHGCDWLGNATLVVLDNWQSFVYHRATAGNRTCPTRGESVRRRRALPQRSRWRSRESHACQRRFRQGIGAEKNSAHL